VLESVVRVVVSLAVVLGLFWMVARTGSRKLGGHDRGLMRVRSRQSLSRGSSLAVVEVGSRVLVVGVSDSGVRLLTEMDPAELSAPADVPAAGAQGDASFEAVYEAAYDQTFAAYQAAPTAGAVAGPVAAPAPLTHQDESGPAPMPTSPLPSPLPGPLPTSADGPLAGSLLAPSTWRQAWSTATNLTARPEHGDAA
jgi:flagellar protein FliO/FliZ